MNSSLEMNGYVLPLRLALKNPDKFKQYLQSNKRELSYWAVLLAGLVCIYFAFSDGEFSFSYTLSAIIRVFGFLLIAMRVHNTRSVNGLSLNTFICYSVSLLARLYAIFFYEGYLPADATGDVIFRASEFFAFLASLVMVGMIAVKFKATYNASIDKINCLVLIVPAFIVACVLHPTLNDEYSGDIPWTFGFYLEMVAMLPQLYMIMKKGGEIEAFTSHFVASQGFSLCFASIFWIGCCDEINEHVGESWTLFAESTGYLLVLCQIIQILLFSDFLYEYIKSMRRGIPMTLDSYIV